MDECKPLFTGCTIENNTAVQFGAGVYMTDKSRVNFTDCVIRGNRAGRGGAGRTNHISHTTS